jgi:hypothetical protein
MAQAIDAANLDDSTADPPPSALHLPGLSTRVERTRGRLVGIVAGSVPSSIDSQVPGPSSQSRLRSPLSTTATTESR